ncbi:2,3-diphosphoglycerate synthetase [Streptomyces sp. BA2]|uniref:2,3-diphosphoglycerate synthetase n=1 Tax=Streptomyces sp. BA2 TaxID=436595 RepID=UPI001327A6D9|nr:2,3-diphosphoglycerate synthetase [Streptomyces sp. BA2]MWA08228.1 2,3-diphosphoglycerate synthetase [Streptomyces sp. BA2]
MRLAADVSQSRSAPQAGDGPPKLRARAAPSAFSLREAGEHPVLALLAGGREKLGQRRLEVGVPVETPEDAEAGLAEALSRTGAGTVFDLSDAPVLSNARRCRMASIALWQRATYRGADFTFTPPPRPPVGGVPSVAVLGMGKRMGKTALTGHAARVWRDSGLSPVVVAMGRGGPSEPQVLGRGSELTPRVLLDWVARGRHAASDYVEGALFAGVPTVGTWRAGGGLAGATCFDDYRRALERALELAPGLLVLESSGCAVPPARTDAGLLVVGAETSPADLFGYFGLYRTLLADLIVLTKCEHDADRQHLAALETIVRETPSPPEVIRTVFRPRPLDGVAGKRVWFATTADPRYGPVLRQHLEDAHGAEVTGLSHALADRDRLRVDLDTQAARGAEVLAVELKAAAVDVVTQCATERDVEVVYVENRPVAPDGAAVDAPFLALSESALTRYRA